jgi:hypothetical protein
MARSPYFSGLWQDDERATILDALRSLPASQPTPGPGPAWTCHRWASADRTVFAASHAGASRMLTAASADELALRLRGYGQPEPSNLTPLAHAA